MLTLRDYVNWGIAHSDNVGKAEGVPLVMEKCKTGKKMKQLEVYGESVQNGTPSPEAPVEVESVGEPCIRNWFDKNKFLSRDGYNVATNYILYKAKYIEGLKPNTKYNVVVERLNGTTPTSAKCTVLFSGSTFSVALGTYTSIGHVSNATETNGSPYTSDENGRLTVGISTSTTQEQLDLLWENTNVYLYEDGDETTVYKVPVTVRGKNLFKPTGVSGDGIGGSGKLALQGSYGTIIDSTDFSDNKVVVTQVPDESYNTAAYQNGYICFLIPELTLGKTYELSFDVNIADNPLNTDSFVCYACTYSIPRVVLSSGTRCKTTFQYKTPSGGRPPYVEVRCGGASFELSNVMITEEGQDDTFEPYIEPQTTNVYLNEPLRKIGDYADYIDFKGKKVVRNTFMRVYDGQPDTNNPFNQRDNEENWGDGSSNENFWQYTLSDTLPIIPKSGYTDYKQMPICLQLSVKTGYFTSTESHSTIEKELIWFSQAGRGVRLFLSKSRAELGDGSISALKAYLKDNPISVLIATYEPYEEPIDCDLPILAGKTTVIDIDTSILPSDIKGKYIKR